MAEAQNSLKSSEVASLLDEIASADPPAYLHRLFAEDVAARSLSAARLRELAAGARVLDAVAGGHDDPDLEPELIADWREHYSVPFAALKPLAARALHASLAHPAADADAPLLDELRALERRLAGG